MDSEIDIQLFINCTQQILGRQKSWDQLNVTQILDLLPNRILEDINLKITLGNCMGLGERPFSPPWWGQLAWFMVFAVMLLLAVLGNTLVIWIVLAHRRMRTVTNCFLVNLAVADLLMATLNGAPNFIFLVTADWPFGAVTCTASNFTANLTVSAGVFTLVAITVDR
ncbi:tachykinin-like peptides receptor 86C [Trichoplusia ni]|nr:tachykinin-like peptides receptor 86C [Trichoplusia ni]XP_026731739.1 tachykinin-like peptides receptor 86C [Trichoplusia ni]XP_026731740.1 tachykinin-like peptides receptor 86C [Trichoplusia ni]